MTGNTLVKILLDITMTVVYLMLMFARGAGEFFHEAAGIGIGILFIIHILLNASMTKGLFRSVNNGKAKTGRIIQFISDILLMICMPVVIVTGILIARELFVIDSGLPWELIFTIHNVLSYVCLGVMAVHLLLHLKYLVGVCKKFPLLLKGGALKSALIRFGAGAAAAVTLYFSVYMALNGNIFSKKENVLYSEKQNIEETEVVPSKPTITENVTEPVQDETLLTENATESVAEQKENSQTVNESTEETAPTLEEFLGNMYCTGCGKHCSLLYPRCGRGEMQAQQAENEYNEMYYSSSN